MISGIKGKDERTCSKKAPLWTKNQVKCQAKGHQAEQVEMVAVMKTLGDWKLNGVLEVMRFGCWPRNELLKNLEMPVCCWG